MPTLGEISAQIEAVSGRLDQQLNAFGWPLDQPLSNFVGTSAPMSAKDFKSYATLVSSKIERLTKVQLDIDGFGTWLSQIYLRLPALQFGSINQSNSIQLANALLLLQMIDAAIPPIPPASPKIDWEDLKDQKGLLPKDLSARLRSIDARLKDYEPRSKEIGKKISDIENAHAAADQLPTDLAELAERRDELSSLISEANELSSQIREYSEQVESSRKNIDDNLKLAESQLKSTSDNASEVLAKSERALRGATAVGLSRAFETRREALSGATKWWTLGLAVALIVALLIGWERVNALKEVLSGDKTSIVIITNAVLALIGIGAPVWFAWLATKQIGTTFRLAEDYAFKASVAQAYEGYRTEALNFDDTMRDRLFASAIDRFEEAPIRLVDPSYHSSPLQELLSNDALRKALEALPNLGDKLRSLVNPSESFPAIGTVAAIGSQRKTGSDDKAVTMLEEGDPG